MTSTILHNPSSVPSHTIHTSHRSSNLTTKRTKAFTGILSSSDSELISLSFSVLKSKVSASNLRIPDSNLLHLIQLVSINYYKNPYHTFKHGVDVMLSLNQFLNFLPFKTTPEETVFLLLIALNHDILHPGCSNKCMAAKNPMLPIITESLSINETISIKKCTELIKETNCFINVNSEQQKEFFGLLNKTILATDIENNKFNQKLQNYNNNYNNKEKRVIQFSVLMRLADVSNCLFTQSDCVNWSYRLYLELNNKKLVKNELNENIKKAFEYQTKFLNDYIKETVKNALMVNIINKEDYKDLENNINLLLIFFEEHKSNISGGNDKLEKEIEKIKYMITWK